MGAVPFSPCYPDPTTRLTVLTLAFAALLHTQPAPPGTLVDAGGYRVHLFCTGTGSPTVIVAGAGFSFDWALVQPGVARFTRICTYDPSGTAWSDPPPKPPACSDRVAELHQVLQHAGIPGPYVLVGYSIGGLYTRLFAHLHPAEVAGMVIVDHAFLNPDIAPPPPKPLSTASHPVYTADQVDTPPVLLSQTPITIGIEDDDNFARLPQRSRDLHRWAMAQHPIRPSTELADECQTILDRATAGQAHPLGAMPLVVISTPNISPNYRRLQAALLALSTNRRQMMADHSTHMVIVDQPETIVAAIREVVLALRK